MTALEAALDEARSQARSRDQKLSVATKELKASRALSVGIADHIQHLSLRLSAIGWPDA